MASLQERFPSDPREHTRCLRSQSRLPIDFGRFSARPGALRRPFRRAGSPLGTLWSSLGGSWDALGAHRRRSRSSLEAPWASWGAAGAPRDRVDIDFGCRRDPKGSILGRFQHPAIIDMTSICWTRLGIELASMWFAQSARRLEWLGRFGGNLSIWLSTTAPTLSLWTCLPCTCCNVLITRVPHASNLV